MNEWIDTNATSPSDMEEFNVPDTFNDDLESYVASPEEWREFIVKQIVKIVKNREVAYIDKFILAIQNLIFNLVMNMYHGLNSTELKEKTEELIRDLKTQVLDKISDLEAIGERRFKTTGEYLKLEIEDLDLDNS